MKKLTFLVAIIIIGFVACSDKENLTVNSNLNAKWLLVSDYYSPGFGYVYKYYTAKDNKTIMFTTDGKVRTTNQGEFNNFDYAIRDSVTLIVIKKNQDDQIWYYWIKSDTLRLSTMSCYEGCGQIYIRQ